MRVRKVCPKLTLFELKTVSNILLAIGKSFERGRSSRILDDKLVYQLITYR